MLSFLKRVIGRSAVKPSMDAISFDTTGYECQGEPQPGSLRVWYTPEGDGLGLFRFRVLPDLPASASSVEALAAYYQQLLGDRGGKMIEVHTITAGGVRAIRTLMAVPQQPSGRTFVGAITLPFRDFSFVLKCQCAEAGWTGGKEALLLDRRLAAGATIAIDGERFSVPDFDPDHPRHDAEFATHPIARARRVLDHLAATLTIADSVRQLPGFALPTTGI